MVSKILLCVVLCFVLIEISCASPAQVAFSQNTTVTPAQHTTKQPEEIVDTDFANCRAFIAKVEDEIKLNSQELRRILVQDELYGAYNKTQEYIKAGRPITDFENIFAESIMNFGVIKKTEHDNIENLMKNAVATLKRCTLGR